MIGLIKTLSALTEAICVHTCALVEHTEQMKHDAECRKSREGIVTKQDLQEMENRMALKLSELKGEVAGLRGQVVKIWTEQQSKYDALVVEFNTLKASLDNVELPADVSTDLAEFRAQLQGFDDSIPDVAPPTPA